MSNDAARLKNAAKDEARELLEMARERMVWLIATINRRGGFDGALIHSIDVLCDRISAHLAVQPAQAEDWEAIQNNQRAESAERHGEEWVREKDTLYWNHASSHWEQNKPEPLAIVAQPIHASREGMVLVPMNLLNDTVNEISEAVRLSAVYNGHEYDFGPIITKIRTYLSAAAAPTAEGNG